MGRTLEGKVAVVTGSGQNIGRAIALLMAAEGARVVTNSRTEVSRDQTPTAADTAREIEASGGSAVAAFADVSTTDGARQVVELAVETFGTVDILVNNAGGSALLESLDTMSDHDRDRVMASNLTSQFACSGIALPVMKRAGSGRIINVGSNVGLFGMAGMTAYAAAKAGVVGLTFALAHELEGSGITVNCLVPTASTRRNERTRAERERVTGHVLQTSPDRTPDAIAPIAGYLASDAASRVSGQVIYSAGGQLTLYSWPPPARTLLKQGHWSVDELHEAVPRYFGTDLTAYGIPLPLG